MNMFSNQWITFEGMIDELQKSDKKGIETKVNKFGETEYRGKASLGKPSKRWQVELLNIWLEGMLSNAILYKKDVITDIDERKWAMH